MLILLLLVAGSAIFSFFYTLKEPNTGFWTSIRVAFIQTLLAGGGLVYLATECLSAINGLTTTAIALFWGMVAGVFGYVSIKKKKRFWTDGVQAYRALPSIGKRTLWVIGLGYLLPLFLLAVIAPPNNTDSVNYHLARVVFWLQNQNVEHYPTVYIQQLYHNVFSEYILLHIMALSNWNDYWVNLVQWLAMLGSVLGIGLVAKELQLSVRSQWVVSILQLTLPIGILESTTTQNDYLAGFLFIAFLYYVMKLLKMAKSSKGKVSWYEFLSIVGWMSLSLALGGFNKYTVFLFGFPLCVWIGVAFLVNRPFKESLMIVGIASAMLLVVFTPFFKRNYDLFGDVLSAPKGTPLFTEEVATERRCVGCAVSVTLKNITAHLGLPIQSYNDGINRMVEEVHDWIGVPVNGPELNVDNYYTSFVIQEDMSHNPWHVVLILVGAVWLLLQKHQRDLKRLLLCSVVGFLLFSTLIKYQMYNTRVEMPFYAMGFIWTGLMLSRFPKIESVTVGLFLLLGLPYVYTNYNKPVLALRQWSKYVLGYIPPFLCAKDGDVETYRRSFGEVYDFANPQPCFALKTSPPYWKRLEIVQQLKQLGYYQTDERVFWQQTREQNYFTEMYHINLYPELKSITKLIPSQTKGVGVLVANVMGFYREWLLIKNQVGHPVRMQYLLYQEECKKAPNAARKFEYDYVLIDHPAMLNMYIDSKTIDHVFTFPHYLLVKLKKTSTQEYTYITRDNVQKYETIR